MLQPNLAAILAGMRARLWRVDEEKWLKFSGEVSGDGADEKSMLRNVSAAYNNNLHVPEKRCATFPQTALAACMPGLTGR